MIPLPAGEPNGPRRDRGFEARLAALAFVVVAVLAVAVGVCVSGAPWIVREQRLSDGEAPTEGGSWDVLEATVLRSLDSAALVDLGSEQRDVRVFLQADANDVYRIESSRDGRRFEPVWDTGVVTGGGLRSRASEPIPLVGRYLRIRALAGDGWYSVGELAVAPAPGLTPPWRWVSATATWRLRAGWWALSALGALVVLLAACFGSGLARAAGAALGVVVAAIGVTIVASLGPLGTTDELVLGSLAALIAMVALLIERTRRGATSKAPLVALALASGLAFVTFFHFGVGQFPDARDGTRTRVHYGDLRNYFPTAKYFDELGYEGVYRASVLTWVAAAAHGDLDAARGVAYRDLDTHRMTYAAFDRPGLEALRGRFSEARFEALLADMEYFRAIMGDELYAGSMIDHGGNATPLWLAVARLVFAGREASDLLFELTAWLDVLSMLFLFVCIERTHGLRTALVVALVFGATEFPNIANNWAGATLRHDWMVAFGLGVCALRVGRFALGGALLTWSAGIRAFPALGLGMVAIALGRRWWVARRAGDPAAAEHARAAKRFVGGAAACAVVIAALSTLVLGPDAWFEWLRKVKLLAAEPHLNHIGVPTFLYHLEQAMKVGRVPGPVTLLGLTISFVVLPFVLVRAVRSEPEDAALFGLLLVPFFSHPANYYAHYVCLIPLLCAPRRGDGVGLAPSGWVMLIHATLTAVLFAGSTHDVEHFEVLSLVYAVTVAALLLTRRAAAPPSAAAALDSPRDRVILGAGGGYSGGEPSPKQVANEALES